MEYALIFNESATSISYYPSTISNDEATSMRSNAQSALSTFNNPVNHFTGTVQYKGKVIDQFGIPMEIIPSLTWTVNSGGVINESQTFVSNGTPGEYTITASNDDYNGTATLIVGTAINTKIEMPGVEINNSNNKIDENFDAIGQEATATLPTGWRVDKQTTAPRTVGSFAVAVEKTEQTGGNSIASNAKNGIWNFGVDDDRAIGGISTGVDGGTRCINVYLHILNNGSLDYENLAIKYDIEKYRQGSNDAGFRAQLYFSIDGIVWESAGDDFYTFFAKDSATAGYASAPGDSKNVNANLNVGIKAGEELYLAWNLSVASGTAANAAQALSLDNVSIEAMTSGVENIGLSSKNVIGYKVVGNTIVFDSQTIETIQLYSINGVLSKLVHNTNEVDISKLNKGIYIAKVKDCDT